MNAAALSYFDNFAGVSAASFANLSNAEINLAQNGGMIDDGKTHIDTLTVTGSSDTLLANGGINVITASGNSNTLVGGSGVDMLNVSGSANLLVAGAGTDELMVSGTGSDNVFVGGAGSDQVDANTNTQQTHDTLLGGSGDDVINVSGNSNTLIAGNGSVNVLSADGGSNTLIAGNGTDILTASGGTGNLLEAGSGTDDLASDAGGNTMIGGAGLTQAFYVANSLTVNLAAGSASVNGSRVATLINISSVNVVGTGDTLTGGTQAGILWGSGQDDTLIRGRRSDDTNQQHGWKYA